MNLERSYCPVLSSTLNRERSTFLLVRRIGRTHMHVAQIPECGLILFTHPPGKIRIIQPLIFRRLGHVLQHLQLLSNRLPPLRRHLLPLG